MGSYCCQPPDGQATPWSLTVPSHAASGQVIIIVVHTGGHVAAVERFAVTGVRVGWSVSRRCWWLFPLGSAVLR